MMDDPRNWQEKATWLCQDVADNYAPGLREEVANALKAAYDLGVQDGYEKARAEATWV